MKICTPNCLCSLVRVIKPSPSEEYELAAEVLAGPVGTQAA